MKTITVKKTKDLKGEITVPGDKSISHRALMFASIADGDTRIKGLLKGEDNLATLKAFRQMGIWIEEHGDIVVVHGNGLNGLREPEDFIDAGNSGTTIRLITGLLAGQNFFSSITGDQYLRKRPMKRVIDPLSQMGARIFGRENGNKAPLAIVGSKLKGITYNSPIASAQVKSAILLAALYTDGLTTVIEPMLSRDHTERMLAYFGAKVERTDNSVSIAGGQKLAGGGEIIVPGDISSATFFMVAALITEGSSLTIRDVGVNPTRTGIIDILRGMGGNIEVLNPREISGEPIGDIHVRSSLLKGIEISGEVIPRAIDELPVVAVAAAFAEGTTKIRDAKELRVKESDRIGTMTVSLRKLGIRVDDSYEDGMDIEGGEPNVTPGSDFNSYGDHRVAMSMIVAGLTAKGDQMLVRDTECIDTSFPGFEELIKRISVQ
ncbi:MAG: 3-phosphoshikimate 1-carboxyvinyltransferase [Deltaproteobacteria bacterium]